MRLVAFYDDKSAWAVDKKEEFDVEVQACLCGGECDISGLIDRLQSFSKELGLMLEFLELNALAFSKIMKKVRLRAAACVSNCSYYPCPDVSAFAKSSLTNEQDQAYEKSRSKNSKSTTTSYMMVAPSKKLKPPQTNGSNSSTLSTPNCVPRKKRSRQQQPPLNSTPKNPR